MIIDGIFVNYDPFSMDIKINIPNEESIKSSSDLDILSEDIINAAYTHNIYSIKIHGPFQISSQIRKRLLELESLTYGENKIKVEEI